MFAPPNIILTKNPHSGHISYTRGGIGAISGADHKLCFALANIVSKCVNTKTLYNPHEESHFEYLIRELELFQNETCDICEVNMPTLHKVDKLYICADCINVGIDITNQIRGTDTQISSVIYVIRDHMLVYERWHNGFLYRIISIDDYINGARIVDSSATFSARCIFSRINYSDKFICESCNTIIEQHRCRRFCQYLLILQITPLADIAPIIYTQLCRLDNSI